MRLLRILPRLANLLSSAVFAATVVAWVSSNHAYRATALATGQSTFHAAVHDGALWVTRTRQWSDAATARQAAIASPAARPIVLRPDLQFIVATIDLEREIERQALNAGRTDRLQRLKTALHADLVARAGGPPAEPVIAEKAPFQQRSLGLTTEQGRIAFPVTGPDGVIRYGPAVPFTATRVPLWIPLLLTAALPALQISLRIRRWYRSPNGRQHGRCPTCNYDLRATPDRCPECGRKPA
jgi:hypothetical protein